MTEMKKKWKKIGRYIWELVKGALPSCLMFACAGAVLVLVAMRGEVTELRWSNGKVAWTVICLAAGIAYAAAMAFIGGGNGYEMLVTGNVKRMSEKDMKMSKHVEAKEYRVWKGFVIGGIIALIPLTSGLFFGANQEKVDAMLYDIIFDKETGQGASTGFALLVIVSLFLSGLSLMPFFLSNATIIATYGSARISYYFGCLFALIPIVVVGVMYIVGAYAKRAKNLRKQAIAEASEAAQANREKKINYGALPGTKPKKRK
ncbi:MAG: hypothetical protein E7355_01045 [Clostridiales bacterium]|nr:hypothetical protein [Clostridiales bacterium]